ncbi:MAG TPA: hypothetical protein VF765_37340 [Polyangiaceae bacterium]
MNHRRLLRALAAVPVVALVTSAAAPAHAVDRRAEAGAKAALKAAGNDYLATNYEAAIVRLFKAARGCGTSRCTKDTQAAVLRDLGTMQFRNGDIGAAKKTWGQALQVKPDLALNPDYDAPDLRAAFDEVRGNAGGTGEQPSGDFSHTPAGEQKINTPLPVYVEYGGGTGLVRVVVKYKGPAMGDWARVDLKRMGTGWGGLIPCSAVTKGALRYWVQGFDDGGDPVASSGDPKHPFTVPVVDDVSGEAPHLPGQSPPKACGEDTDCPPGLPGCAPEENNEEKGGGGEGDEGETSEASKPAPGAYAHWWFGIAGALDLLSLPSGRDVCLLNPPNTTNAAKPVNSANYYCTNPDGTDFPSRKDGGVQNGNLQQPGGAGQVEGGFQPGDVRVMLTADYAVSSALMLGVRLGYVLNSYTGTAAVSDGHAFGSKLHFEARGTYLIGHQPLANVGIAPMVIAGAGAAEFDGSQTTVVSTKNVAGQQPVNAWKTAGPLFLLLGGGIRYAFSPRAAVTLAARINMAVSGGFMLTYGPEVGVQYGF